MPTSKPQCALVYALNALLLFNMTVIVVMLTGSGPEQQSYAEQPVQPANSLVEPERRVVPYAPADDVRVGFDDAPVIAEADRTPIEAIEPVEDVPARLPVVQIQKVSTEAAVAPISPQASKPQPTQTEPIEKADSPIEFFGVGLE